METGFFSRTQSIEDVNLEIETLFHSGEGHRDEIFKPINPLISTVDDHDEHGWKEWRALSDIKGRNPIVHVRRQPSRPDLSRIANAVWREWYRQQPKHEDSLEEIQEGSPSEGEEFTFQRDVTVKGADIGEAPTEYTVKDIFSHEMPVIGNYVDKRVVQGFQYKIRINQTNKYLFNGKPLVLQSIGKGYGKRITFKSQSFITNNNYFYSDTQADGYAFSIQAVDVGAEFIVCEDDGIAVGRAIIEDASLPQTEISMEIQDDGAIVKHVHVNLQCSVIYESSSHGMMSLRANDEGVQISGIAKVVKYPRAKEAVVELIENIDLPAIGPCYFTAE